MKNWAKWTGTELYADYILPTNPGSRNPLIKKMYEGKNMGFRDFGDDIITALKGRKKFSYLMLKFHAPLSIIILIGNSYAGHNLLSHFLNLFINIYPSLYQIHIIEKIDKILKQKNK